MIKLKEILKEEKWEVKNDGDGYGKVTLNGKPVATWYYDEDSDSFWTKDAKTFRGEKSFDSRQEIIDYLKKNGAGKPGWNYDAYDFKNYESNIKEELQSNILKEAEEVDFNQLLPQQQKQVQAFEKVLGGKHSQIWDGIHGKIVDIKTQSYYGNYRFDIDTMKKLVALKARWVEADGQRVSVGF